MPHIVAIALLSLQSPKTMGTYLGMRMDILPDQKSDLSELRVGHGWLPR